jgi:hypothetical protein
MVAGAGQGGQPGQQGGKTTKSPAEIQAESAEAQGKLQVEQQGNMVKMAEVQAQEQIERERLQQTQLKDAADLAIRHREISSREGLEQARMARLENASTQGLV